MTTYDKRDLLTLTGTFTTAAGVATDPTAVLLVVEDPDGAEIGYTYGWSSQGNWNAATNTPTLADGTGTAGHYYTVSVAGSVNFGSGSITFTAGQIVYYNGYVWQKLNSRSATTLTKASTGVYTCPVYMRQVGDWQYSFEGLGTGQAGGESNFTVRASHR